MANQTSSRVRVDLKRQPTLNTLPGDTNAQQLRIIGGPGLSLTRDPLDSQELRVDANAPTTRLGPKKVDGSYDIELTVGGAVDTLLEAIMRSTWTAAVAITNSEMTSITTTATEIVAAGGSWISEGVRVGDVVRLTNHSTAGNNDINLRVVTVTASTLTIAGTAPLTLDNSADSSFSLTILKKLVTVTAGPTDYAHAIEQRDIDIDLSEVFTDVHIVGLNLSFRPGEYVKASLTLMGLDRTLFASGDSPYYTTPSVTTGLGLTSEDASVYYNGAVVSKFTGFDLTMQIAAGRPSVIGSAIAADVFTNRLKVTGQITGIRQDFANLILFDAETEFGIGFTLQENGTAPVGTHAFWLPRAKILGASAPVGGGDGAKIETLELDISTAVSTSSVDATNVIVQSSAA